MFHEDDGSCDLASEGVGHVLECLACLGGPWVAHVR